MRSAALAPAPSLKKTLLKLQRLPGANFRPAFAAGVSANRVCLERELLDHYRLVFEKMPSPVWLSDSVGCGRFGPGGVSSDWGRVTGSGSRAG